jgi:SNF2 family DNA or RNA helicase
MKVSLLENNRFLIECDDLDLLAIMQETMDGDKVRSKPMITVPLKSGVMIPRFKEYGIDIDESSKQIINKLISNLKLRVVNIQKIKDQYGKEIKFDYEYKGIYTPMEHQKIMFNAIYYTEGSAILADPGTCKTGSYLWAIDKRIQNKKIKKALIVTLTDLKKNILEEMSIQVPHLKGVILDNKAQSNKILNKSFKASTSVKKNIDYDIYIANYESMYSIVELVNENYFDMVVLDEAHRIGFPTSRQTLAIVNTFENCKYKYVITGTLHANNLMSFFMPFRFLGPDTLPYAKYNEFRRRYMYPVDPNQYVWVPVAGAKDVVNKITGAISVMFKKEDCLDLPPLIYEKYSCPMASGQEKLYKQLKNDLVAMIDGMCDKCNKKGDCDRSCESHITAKNALVLHGKLHQIASGFYINTKIGVDEKTGTEFNNSNIITLNENPKMQLLISTLNNMPDDSQVIIWTNYTHACKLITEALSKAFGPKSFITCFGDQDAYNQTKLFQSSGVSFMVANPKKLGVGQNIQFSHYQIFFSNSRSYVTRDQAVGRQHRQGQKEKVTVIDLITEDTVDELALKSLLAKQDLNLTLSQLSRVLKNPKEMDKIIDKRSKS